MTAVREGLRSWGLSLLLPLLVPFLFLSCTAGPMQGQSTAKAFGVPSSFEPAVYLVHSTEKEFESWTRLSTRGLAWEGLLEENGNSTLLQEFTEHPKKPSVNANNNIYSNVTAKEYMNDEKEEERREAPNHQRWPLCTLSRTLPSPCAPLSTGAREGHRVAVLVPVMRRPAYVRLCAASLKDTVPPEDIWVLNQDPLALPDRHLFEWFGDGVRILHRRRGDRETEGREDGVSSFSNSSFASKSFFFETLSPPEQANLNTQVLLSVLSLRLLPEKTKPPVLRLLTNVLSAYPDPSEVPFYTHIAVIDSDLVVRPDWWSEAVGLMRASREAGLFGGFFSLFNSHSHMHPDVACFELEKSAENAFGDRRHSTVGVCEKKSVGHAGSIHEVDFLVRLIEQFAGRFFTDWDLSNFARTRHVRLLVPLRSLALHVGMEGGANGEASREERARGFEWSSLEPSLALSALRFLYNNFGLPGEARELYL